MRVFKDMIRTHKPILVGIFETKLSGSQADDICRRFGFDQWVRVEALCFSGGVWVFWNEETEVQVKHDFFDWWYISFVYGSPTPPS